jgi:hypothetical protein
MHILKPARAGIDCRRVAPFHDQPTRHSVSRTTTRGNGSLLEIHRWIPSEFENQGHMDRQATEGLVLPSTAPRLAAASSRNGFTV